MKWSRSTSALALTAAVMAGVAARADLAPWMQTVVSGSAIEAALYRLMDLPGLRALYPRPPAEVRDALNSLVAAKPDAAQLYALRAHVDEDALDFVAAEKDWTAFVAHSAGAEAHAAAQFQLADYYHRRNAGPEEIAALEAAAAAPSPAAESFIASDQQAAWKAFSRALAVARDQGLSEEAELAIYRAWIARYPAEPSVRTSFFSALLEGQRYDDAQRAINEYKAAFPQDEVTPIRSAALLALEQGESAATARALALFDAAYRPLWPSDLVATYFQLLDATHTRHAMLASTRDRLVQNPDDLTAASKLFNAYRQQGRLDAAASSLAAYGASKEARHAAWSATELYTFATLLYQTGRYAEAARYDYALASTRGRIDGVRESPEEAGLAGLIHILLTAPEQPIDLGSGNLSMYRDIAALDSGPGYLNGILSLWLNSTYPASSFHDEEQKATPYFHREEAAALLTALDQRFPAAMARAALHAQLIAAYVSYGQDDAVKQAGKAFLAGFPQAPQRLQVALQMADADARTHDTAAEYALYDATLAELASKLKGMPLTAANTKPAAATTSAAPEEPTYEEPKPAAKADASELLRQSLTAPVAAPASASIAAEYSQVLERYLGRLTESQQLPAALAVLRREVDRNPDDPLLYERLASFLQQNNLAAQEEQVYQRALARFHDATFYDKLARLYLRQKRSADFGTLTRKVVDIFEGSELERYFANVTNPQPSNPLGAQMYLQLNLYAHQRFPHELIFTRNLLSAYRTKALQQSLPWEKLLREHWQEAPDLQAEFFDYLRRTNKLGAEKAALEALLPSAAAQQQDPAAARELAELHLWQSHFELGAPLLNGLAQAYPADVAVGTKAASLFRSLAYFDPAKVETAVAIQKHLSAADPTDLERIATIGDIYADSTASSLNLDPALQLAQAAPFWRRIGSVHPGVADGYLQSATVFWDYFQFDDALQQIFAARKRLDDPALYGYEAGAIYEDKQDFPHAIDEYVAAAADDAGQAARNRLLSLATRKSYAVLVDAASTKRLAEHPSLAGLELRVDVLHAQHKQDSIAPLVEAAIAKENAAEELEGYAKFAASHQLPRAYQSALRKQIALANDPVQRIQLTYELAHSLEEQKDVAAAQKLIEEVHAANPRLVGVVRETTDFYWDNKQPQRAIATLVLAAHDANASLAHDYTLEAIDKSNRSGDFAGARNLLKPLLAADPFNAQYLNLQAQSFSLAHDDAGVRDLYASTIAALQSAPLSRLDRRDKIALARQSLIPALTSLKDYEGATAQHIALISAFPEDAGILQSATAYARLHGREAQLVAFLQKAADDSPRDSRFAIALAAVDVQFEDYAGALAAYSRAIAIRADRPDLYIARADLEEHQQAFDAACADYERLYALMYKDPQWMEKAALARARQGKADLAVKALQLAWIEGRPPAAANFFRVARQLADWNLLAQADAFAQQGVHLAGNDLLATAANQEGAVFYARLLARERKAAESFVLYARLSEAAKLSPSSPAIVLRQVQKKGLASVTDAEWRRQLVEKRRQQAQTTYREAVQAMAVVAGELYTPEEKTSFATMLDARRANRPAEEVTGLWIPAAKSAGLVDRELAWRRDVLLHGGALAAAQLAPLNALATERMDSTLLAETLELYAQQLKPKEQIPVLTMAAQAWRDAGNTQRETASLRRLVLTRDQQQLQQRLFELYLHGDTAALLALTAGKTPVGEAAANFVLASGTEAQARQAVAQRATLQPAVWSSATSALVGLYFGDTSSVTNSAFESALANNTLGERLATKPDESKQIIGKMWFYYGARYGYFLTLAPKPAHDPEDYLAAELEREGVNSASFNALAQTYLDAHQVDAAITEYRHVTELDPADPAPNISIAEAMWNDGRKDAALAEWNEALVKLREMVDLRAVPETFWTEFAAVAGDASAFRLGRTLKPAMDIVLTAYLRKNAGYRSTELLQDAFLALSAESPADAAVWAITLVGEVPTDSQSPLLSDLEGIKDFPDSQRDLIYRRQIALAQAAIQLEPADAEGNREYALSSLTSIQSHYIAWLLKNNHADAAQRVLDTIAQKQRNTAELQGLALQLAAKQQRIPELLSTYTGDPDLAPSLTSIATAANTLRLEKDSRNSRLLLEYVFTQKLQLQSLAAPDFLALAEARIATGDVAGAMDLLRRLTLQGDLYENLDSATNLLVRTGHHAEALPMLLQLANGVPWNAEFRLRLGESQRAAKQTAEAGASLAAVAADAQAPYSARAAAATDVAGLGNVAHSLPTELVLLAEGRATPLAADKPYFVYARIAAAEKALPAQRAGLLRTALKSAPETMTDWLHLQIFRAELAQARYEQASVAIAPVLAANPNLRVSAPVNDLSDAIEDESSAEVLPIDTPAKTYADQRFTVSASMQADEDKRAFALSLATMHDHLGQTAETLKDLRAARMFTTAPVEIAALEKRIDTLQDKLDVAAENALRRPVLKSSLEEIVLVRPRVTTMIAAQKERPLP